MGTIITAVVILALILAGIGHVVATRRYVKGEQDRTNDTLNN